MTPHAERVDPIVPKPLIAAVDAQRRALAEQVRGTAIRKRQSITTGITGATHPVIDYPIESWLKVMDVNVNGLFYCCRFVAPLMVENGYGRIVNISSVAGKEGNPNAGSYSASKAAVLGFTKSLGK